MTAVISLWASRALSHREDGGPCSISATMVGQNYSAVSIVVTGLQSKEEFQIDQRSGSEAGRAKATAAEDGTTGPLSFLS